MGILLGWIIGSFIAGFIGIGKTIGFWGALFLSLLLSPLVGIIAAVVSRSQEEADIQKKILENQTEMISETITKSESPADEIKKYKLLLDDGTITHVEFEAKKKQLLGL